MSEISSDVVKDWINGVGDIDIRIKCAKRSVTKYTEKALGEEHWDKLKEVLESKCPLILIDKYFSQAKAALISRIKHKYSSVFNWTGAYSDFHYAINAVEFWAEIAGDWGILK